MGKLFNRLLAQLKETGGTELVEQLKESQVFERTTHYRIFKAPGSTGALLTAHGAYGDQQKYTVPQGMTVYFYCPHDTLLFDRNDGWQTARTLVTRILEERVEPVETANAGDDVYNYYLSRLQSCDERTQDYTDLFEEFQNLDNERELDIITVRKRWFLRKNRVRLGTILTALSGRYTEVHLSICRGEMVRQGPKMDALRIYDPDQGREIGTYGALHGPSQQDEDDGYWSD
ncbi:MAG: hypothetical protein VYC39_09985 [Myxococcota bacterium]|nr:hypothetical protein [Myxococcota bacterium]